MPSHQPQTSLAEAITLSLKIYILPVIIFVGVILNLLSFFVMKRIRSTTSYYMSILGLTDTGVLITGGMSLWLYTTFNWTFFHISGLSCKMFTFATYTMLDLSVAIIVIMTGERFFAVSRPLQVNQLFNKKKSTVIVFIAFCMCALVNSHFLFTHTIKYHTKSSNPLETVKDKVDFLLDYYYHNLTDSITGDESVNHTQGFRRRRFTNYHYHDEFENSEVKDDLDERFENLSKIYQNSNSCVCTHEYWHGFYDHYWPLIDATIYSFLPFLLLSIFNISIVRYLVKAAKDSSKLKLYQKPLIGTFVSFQKKSHSNDQKSSNESSKSVGGVNCVGDNTQLVIQIGNTPTHNSSLNGLGSCNNLQATPKAVHFGHHGSNLNIEANSGAAGSGGAGKMVKSSSIDKMDKMKKKKYTASEYTLNLTPTHYQQKLSRQSYKGINKRLTGMLFLINVSFCVLSMPMVILQINHFYKLSAQQKQASLKPSEILDKEEMNKAINLFKSGNMTLIEIIDEIIFAAYGKPDTSDEVNKLNLLVTIAELLQYLNHSTNFFLYSFSGKTFRKETKLCLLHYFNLFNAFKSRMKFKIRISRS